MLYICRPRYRYTDILDGLVVEFLGEMRTSFKLPTRVRPIVYDSRSVSSRRHSGPLWSLLLRTIRRVAAAQEAKKETEEEV